jgi:hypothetical protein
MSNFLLSVEMQNSSLYMVKSVIVKSVKIAANGLRAGDRSPVLRLRQGYGACTLLVAAIHIFCSMSIVLNLVEDAIQNS